MLGTGPRDPNDSVVIPIDAGGHKCTAELKEKAVKHAQAVGVGAAARELRLVEQTLRNCVKAAQADTLAGVDAKLVRPEQMELSQLRTQNARLRMNVDILEKGDCVLRQGCAVKYAWIDAQRRGGKLDRTRLSDAQALTLMRSIHAEFRAAYGSRRMHRELQGSTCRIALSWALEPDPMSLASLSARITEPNHTLHAASRHARPTT